MLSTKTMLAAALTVIIPAVSSASEFETESVNLKKGAVTVYNAGDIRLHAYETQDPMNDYQFVFESRDGLVLLESTALKDNVEIFADYIKSLNKPLKGELLSYHPNGYTSYHSEVYATSGAVRSWNEGSVKGLTQQFVSGFGKDAVATDLPEAVEEIKIGDTLTLAGIDFEIVDGYTPEGHFDVVIPQMNTIYTHMMGSKVHNILPSTAAIDSEINRFENISNKHYDLILTSHCKPESQAGVLEKINYLKTVKKIASYAKNSKEFTALVNEAFPSYEGKMYLEMTASMLYKK